MRTCTVVALVVLVGLATATIDPVPHKIADKQFLSNQKKLLEFVWHISQPLWDPKQIEISNNFKLEDNIDNFKNSEVVNKFINLYNHGFFKKRGQAFTPYNKHDAWQAKALVDLLYNAKDFDTFYNVSVWARGHLNAGLFAYSFSIAKLHREDTYDLVLPPAYEIFPQFFVKPEVIAEAYQAYGQGLALNKDEPYVVYANFSTYPTSRTADELVSYFTDDVGFAAYFNFMQLRYPFWAKMEDYGQERYKRRGDHFYFGLQHLLSRYNLERQSNHLPDVRGWGYNGEQLPQDYSIELANGFEQRLYTAIDQGFLIDPSGTKYSLRDPASIELFGRAVEGNADSVHKDLYGSFFRILIEVLASGKPRPGQFDHPATTVRSPLFYRIVQRTSTVFKQYKDRLGPYPKNELEFPGVRVDGVTVDKLITFFDNYDFELNNALAVPSAEVGSKLNIVARTQRLSHKPFNYQIKVSSEKDVDAFVRVFYGPRYDVYGKELSFDEARRKFIYIDSFLFKLKKGTNVLERNSRQFNYYGQQPLSFSKLYEKTNNALNGNAEVYIDDFVNKYGDAERLLLPKGTRSGLSIRFYVIVKPFTHTTISKINPYTDDVGAHVSLFPFDRPINDVEFHVPNSGYTDAAIFHRARDEVLGA